MKCPIDQSEMETGKLGSRGTGSFNMWISDISRKSIFGIFKSGPDVIAYRCPKCGKIELTTNKKESEAK